MKAIVKWAKAEWMRWFGLRVVVHWEGDRYEHLCATHKAALGWMACYPQDASVFVYEFDRADYGRAAC